MRYAICDMRETGGHGEYYLYGHCTCSGLFIRIVLFQSHIIVLPPTHTYIAIASFSLQGISLRHGSFSSAGGPFLDYLHVQKGLSCPSVGYAQASIYISTCACVVFCMASLFASTKLRLFL